MAVNGILLGQNTDNTPLIFDVDKIDKSDYSSIKTQIDEAYGKREIIAYRDEIGYTYIVTNNSNYAIFMQATDSKINTLKLDYSSKSFSVQSVGYKTFQQKVSLLSTKWTESGNKYTQTADAPYVESNEFFQEIHITPSIDSMTAYMESGIYASGQGTNQITFTASKKPVSDLNVYVLIKE